MQAENKRNKSSSYNEPSQKAEEAGVGGCARKMKIMKAEEMLKTVMQRDWWSRTEDYMLSWYLTARAMVASGFNKRRAMSCARECKPNGLATSVAPL